MRLSLLCVLSTLMVVVFQISVLAQNVTPRSSGVRLESSDLFAEALEIKISPSRQVDSSVYDKLERFGQAEEAQIGTHGNLERKAAERLLQIQTTPDPQSFMAIQVYGGNVPEHRKSLRSERVIAEYVNLLVEKNPPPGTSPEPDPLKVVAKRL